VHYSDPAGQAGEGEHPDLGMGFVHFEECLIQLAINLSPQWANGSPNILLFVPEVRDSMDVQDAV
jgi:hypothetical protein